MVPVEQAVVRPELELVRALAQWLPVAVVGPVVVPAVAAAMVVVATEQAVLAAQVVLVVQAARLDMAVPAREVCASHLALNRR